MKHKHHIIPSHAGGTNDPSNIVELTVEEHAEAHKLLYENNGYEQDRIAWKALSGQIGKEELQIQLSRLGGMKTGGWNKGIPWSKEVKETISKSRLGYIRSEESKKKQSKTVFGEGNHFYGKKHTEETRIKMRTPKTYVSGSNPKAHKINYLDCIYSSIAEMSITTGLNSYRIKQLIMENKARRIT